MAYLLHGGVFLKITAANPAAVYADFGCSFETFTNNELLEIETPGPMTKVAVNKSVEHVEHWSLHRNVTLTGFSDAEIGNCCRWSSKRPQNEPPAPLKSCSGTRSQTSEASAFR